MMPTKPPPSNSPLIGKTYSLWGLSPDSETFYQCLAKVADDLLQRGFNLSELVSQVRQLSRNKHRLRRLASNPTNHTTESELIGTLKSTFAEYTTRVADHLKTLPFHQRWDKTLSTNEEQYHLFMIEIELVNRLNVDSFRRCDTKLAFLPHCLRDLTADCHSAIRGEDYVCRGCSKICTVNAVTKMLRRHGVQPYIWMTANLKSLFKTLRKSGKTVGILGIACIPELVHGMRMCSRAGVPVLGIPLNANRCARWWGEFYPNSINLQRLENLLGKETLLAPRARRASLEAASMTHAV